MGSVVHDVKRASELLEEGEDEQRLVQDALVYAGRPKVASGLGTEVLPRAFQSIDVVEPLKSMSWLVMVGSVEPHQKPEHRPPAARQLCAQIVKEVWVVWVRVDLLWVEETNEDLRNIVSGGDSQCWGNDTLEPRVQPQRPALQDARAGQGDSQQRATGS